MLHEIRQDTVAEGLTAVVAARTSWKELTNAWPAMLGEVYDCLEQLDVGKAGRNVMFYKDDVPNLEVGVEVSASCTPRGRVTLRTSRRERRNSCPLRSVSRVVESPSGCAGLVPGQRRKGRRTPLGGVRAYPGR